MYFKVLTFELRTEILFILAIFNSPCFSLTRLWLITASSGTKWYCQIGAQCELGFTVRIITLVISSSLYIQVENGVKFHWRRWHTLSFEFMYFFFFLYNRCKSVTFYTAHHFCGVLSALTHLTTAVVLHVCHFSESALGFVLEFHLRCACVEGATLLSSNLFSKATLPKATDCLFDGEHLH